MINSLRRAGSREKLIILPAIILPFGITIILPSAVRIVVEKICTLCTVPATPPRSTYSPARNGRNSTSNTPAARLDREPCNAKPTAKPAAPSTAITDAVCTPTRPNAAISVKAIIAYRANAEIKSATVASMLREIIRRFTALEIIRAIIKPMMMIARAATMFTA